MPLSDADLIGRMRGGDDRAYEELYQRHAGAVLRYARSCCCDAQAAEDLTCEVLTRTLQAVRGGAGPDSAVRAYLLAAVRWVAADWTKTSRCEQLVEDFAMFAASAEFVARTSTADGGTLDVGKDVRAMHEAEQAPAVRVFRGLPERWQIVLWHTTVEEESPSEVAPLLGLTANATAVLAHRAREGLEQAYLQAYVGTALASGGDCARYAGLLGAYMRGGLRMRAERGLRGHLETCTRCHAAALEVEDVSARLRSLLPVAVVGWFAAGYVLKAAAAAEVTAGTAAGAGAATAAGGNGTGSGGLSRPVKAAIVAGTVVVAVATVFALTAGDGELRKEAQPSAMPVVPQKPGTDPTPWPEQETGRLAPTEPAPSTRAGAKLSPATVGPKSPQQTGKPVLKPTSPTTPERTPPGPKPTPSPATTSYHLDELSYDVAGDGTKPEVRLSGSSLLWQRKSLRIGGTRYGHGATVHGRSSVTIDLNRPCTAYDALVGVDDTALSLGAVRFSVYGDGARLWRSGVVRGGDAAVPVHVPLSGRTTIRLVVEPQSALEAVTPADWAESRIICG
jgi:RNA polymerase sigma factor (sigma-70 family)